MAAGELARLLEVREAAIEASRSGYRSLGLREVSVPVIVGITGACENISTLYRLDAEAPMHLTQTGQLALEHALQFVKGVYCVTPSFRTDHIDSRHLNEFTLVEEEICCDHPAVGMSVAEYDSARMFDVLLSRITASVTGIIRGCLDNAPDALGELGGDLEYLNQVARGEFHRVTYSEALELIRAAGGPDLRWGSDLGSQTEQALLRHFAREDARPLPVFVTHYPKEIKFFNMKEDDEDPRVVQSADLLLPGVGEAVGSAVREHRYDKLVARLTGSVMFQHITERGLATLEDFQPYLDVVGEGRTSPHAGYGIGLERVVQYMLGSSDIRTSSVHYTLSDLMGFTRRLAAAQTGSRAAGF